MLAAVCAQLVVEPFSDVDAITAAGLYPATSGHGLSLGDRACLVWRSLAACTCPRCARSPPWVGLQVGVEV